MVCQRWWVVRRHPVWRCENGSNLLCIWRYRLQILSVSSCLCICIWWRGDNSELTIIACNPQSLVSGGYAMFSSVSFWSKLFLCMTIIDQWSKLVIICHPSHQIWYTSATFAQVPLIFLFFYYCIRHVFSESMIAIDCCWGAVANYTNSPQPPHSFQLLTRVANANIEASRAFDCYQATSSNSVSFLLSRLFHNY